eukprot:10529927-Prorocentrum_lima.AAC.1
MTSSLVGSEMCIRDRLVIVNVLANVLSRVEVAIRHNVLRQRRPHAIQLPVSYTHLTLPTICSV